jgi:hypothetical protein
MPAATNMTHLLCHALQLLLIIHSVSVSAATVTQQQQSRYLKEITTGRCYFLFLEDADACPSLIRSVTSVLDAPDDSIRAADFEPYYTRSNLTSFTSVFAPAESMGGAILDKLVLCGTNPSGNCKAMTAFWTGLYAAYAKQFAGRDIAIVVEDDSDGSIQMVALVQGAIPQFHASSNVTLYATNCAKDNDRVASIQEALTKQGIKEASCVQVSSVSCLPADAYATKQHNTADDDAYGYHAKDNKSSSKNDAQSKPKRGFQFLYVMGMFMVGATIYVFRPDRWVRGALSSTTSYQHIPSMQSYQMNI